MKIKTFEVTVACYDEGKSGPRELEDAIHHGLMEHTGGAVRARLVSTRHVDYPDIDYGVTPAVSFDRQVADWDARANRELRRRKQPTKGRAK